MLVVGRGGRGGFTQNGGTVTASLSVGLLSGGSGDYHLLDGVLSGADTTVGAEGTGSFIQHGGRHEVSGYLSLGVDDGGRGHYLLAGGELSANVTFVGECGAGTFTQTGGTHTAGWYLSVAQHVGSVGRYEFGDGLVAAEYLLVGARGTGTFCQTGGVNTVGTALYLAHLTLFGVGRANYTISAGTLEVPNGFISVGDGGPARFQLDGGTVIADEMHLGENGSFGSTGAGGTLRVNTLTGFGPVCAFAGSLHIGHAGGAGAASYSIAPAEGLLIGGDLVVGYDAPGELTQTGGSNTVGGALALGREPGGAGSYAISAGSLDAGEVRIGEGGSGTLEVAGSSAAITVANVLRFGGDSHVSAVPGSTIHMCGADLDNRNTDATDLSGLGNLTLVFEGGRGVVSRVEVAGEDLGPSASGWTDNFAVFGLTLGGADAGRVHLADDFDNRQDGDANEALYVGVLAIHAGADIVLDGLNLYYLNGGEPKQFFRGDTQLDGVVDILDLAVLSNRLGETGATWEKADFNGDGTVDVLDLVIVAGNYGRITGAAGLPTCAGQAGGSTAAPVPEPATLWVLSGACLALLRRRAVKGRESHRSPSAGCT